MRGVHLGGFIEIHTDNWRRRWRRTRASSASWTGDWNTASAREVFMPFSVFAEAPGGDGGGPDLARSRIMMGVGR